MSEVVPRSRRAHAVRAGCGRRGRRERRRLPPAGHAAQPVLLARALGARRRGVRLPRRRVRGGPRPCEPHRAARCPRAHATPPPHPRSRATRRRRCSCGGGGRCYWWWWCCCWYCCCWYCCCWYCCCCCCCFPAQGQRGALGRLLSLAAAHARRVRSAACPAGAATAAERRRHARTRLHAPPAPQGRHAHLPAPLPGANGSEQAEEARVHECLLRVLSRVESRESSCSFLCARARRPAYRCTTESILPSINLVKLGARARVDSLRSLSLRNGRCTDGSDERMPRVHMSQFAVAGSERASTSAGARYARRLTSPFGRPLQWSRCYRASV